MATLREHIEAIHNPPSLQMHEDEIIEFMKEHAAAALAILDFKPLDSDTPKSGDA